MTEPFSGWKLRLASANGWEAVVESAEYIANDRAKQHEDRNNNDSDQNKDQSILNETLAFFFRGE